MKKIVAFLLIMSILMVSMVTPVFAKAKQCPKCHVGVYISTTKSNWVTHYGRAYVSAGQWVRDYWEEQVVIVKCTEGTHTTTNIRKIGTVLTNPLF